MKQEDLSIIQNQFNFFELIKIKSSRSIIEYQNAKFRNLQSVERAGAEWSDAIVTQQRALYDCNIYTVASSSVTIVPLRTAPRRSAGCKLRNCTGQFVRSCFYKFRLIKNTKTDNQ